MTESPAVSIVRKMPSISRKIGTGQRQRFCLNTAKQRAKHAKKKPTGCIPWASGGRKQPSRDGFVDPVNNNGGATSPALVEWWKEIEKDKRPFLADFTFFPLARNRGV
jgi:hypothetical protein